MIDKVLSLGKNYEHIELLQLHKTNIQVAEYLTVLPPKDVLIEKLHKAIEIAKSQIELAQIDLDQMDFEGKD